MGNGGVKKGVIGDTLPIVPSLKIRPVKGRGRLSARGLAHGTRKRVRITPYGSGSLGEGDIQGTPSPIIPSLMYSPRRGGVARC